MVRWELTILLFVLGIENYCWTAEISSHEPIERKEEDKPGYNICSNSQSNLHDTFKHTLKLGTLFSHRFSLPTYFLYNQIKSSALPDKSGLQNIANPSCENSWKGYQSNNNYRLITRILTTPSTFNNDNQTTYDSHTALQSNHKESDPGIVHALLRQQQSKNDFDHSKKSVNYSAHRAIGIWNMEESNEYSFKKLPQKVQLHIQSYIQSHIIKQFPLTAQFPNRQKLISWLHKNRSNWDHNLVCLSQITSEIKNRIPPIRLIHACIRDLLNQKMNDLLWIEFLENNLTVEANRWGWCSSNLSQMNLRQKIFLICLRRHSRKLYQYDDYLKFNSDNTVSLKRNPLPYFKLLFSSNIPFPLTKKFCANRDKELKKWCIDDIKITSQIKHEPLKWILARYRMSRDQLRERLSTRDKDILKKIQKLKNNTEVHKAIGIWNMEKSNKQSFLHLPTEIRILIINQLPVAKLIQSLRRDFWDNNLDYLSKITSEIWNLPHFTFIQNPLRYLLKQKINALLIAKKKKNKRQTFQEKLTEEAEIWGLNLSGSSSISFSQNIFLICLQWHNMKLYDEDNFKFKINADKTLSFKHNPLPFFKLLFSSDIPFALAEKFYSERDEELKKWHKIKDPKLYKDLSKRDKEILEEILKFKEKAETESF